MRTDDDLLDVPLQGRQATRDIDDRVGQVGRLLRANEGLTGAAHEYR